MIELGKAYYFQVHAYHHFIGVVTAIEGSRACVIGTVGAMDVVRVQDCARDWTEFFADGCKDDTTLTWWPGGKSITFYDATPWHHPIPERPVNARG